MPLAGESKVVSDVHQVCGCFLQHLQRPFDSPTKHVLVGGQSCGFLKGAREMAGPHLQQVGHLRQRHVGREIIVDECNYLPQLVGRETASIVSQSRPRRRVAGNLGGSKRKPHVLTEQLAGRTVGEEFVVQGQHDVAKLVVFGCP